MRRFTFLIVLIVLLLAGGALTSLLIASGGQVLPVMQQVNAPDASPTTLLPWKANQFFILIAFVLFNLVGIAVTIAILLWLLDWGSRRRAANAVNAKTASPEQQASS